MLKWQWVYFPSFGNASYKIKKPYVQYHCIGQKGNKLKKKTGEKDFEKKKCVSNSDSSHLGCTQLEKQTAI